MKPLDLLQFTRGRLEARRAAKEIYAERLAPDFSIFEFLDTRENGLSRVLAWLLDPAGNHAQSDRFLIAFLRWLGLDDVWVSRAPSARAWLEVPTTVGPQAGFIDVVIQMGGRALAIENKPFAIDQPRQVERYLDHLAHQSRDGHCLLYLSHGGEGPSEASISSDRADAEVSEGTLVVRGYPSLVEFLETCLGACRAPNVAMAIEGLILHIRKVFMGMGDVHGTSDLARAVTDDPAMIGAALALFEAERPIRDMILQRFDAAVREKMAGRGWHVIRSNLSNERHSGYIIGFAENATKGFGFQFDQAGYGWLFYGAASEDGRGIAASAKPTLRAFIGTNAETEWWPAWKRVSPNDRHFPLSTQTDREFWLMAYDGRLADMLVQFVAEAENALTAAGVLAAFRGN